MIHIVVCCSHFLNSSFLWKTTRPTLNLQTLLWMYAALFILDSLPNETKTFWNDKEYLLQNNFDTVFVFISFCSTLSFFFPVCQGILSATNLNSCNESIHLPTLMHAIHLPVWKCTQGIFTKPQHSMNLLFYQLSDMHWGWDTLDSLFPVQNKIIDCVSNSWLFWLTSMEQQSGSPSYHLSH